jgi:hypothetical protein
MVLIQNMDVPQPTNTEDELIISDPVLLDTISEPEPEVDNISNRFTIRSSPFHSGKYVIEETEEGFFIVNIRNGNRMFLINVKTMYGGSIMITKGPDKKSFTIIKTLSASTIHAGSSYIIGSIKKMGLLLKFTSFDKSICNLTITV